MSVIEVGCPSAAWLMAVPSSALENPKTKPAMRQGQTHLNGVSIDYLLTHRLGAYLIGP
jgi:hypothetical protein